MRILGISGSLRDESYNTKLLRAAGELLAAAGAEVDVYEGLKEVPAYDADDDFPPGPPPVARLRDAVATADAILIATPEYNSSVPGHLKNALDWVSRPIASNPLRNVPVAVIGASTGMFGAVWAQAELRKVAAAIGARVLEVELPVGHAHTRFDEEGRLIDDSIREQLQAVVDHLVAETAEALQRAVAV
jgi:chromate reductase